MGQLRAADFIWQFAGAQGHTGSLVEVGEAQQACCHPALIYHPGPALLLENPEGASRSQERKPTESSDPRGPSQPFSSLSVVLSVSAWQHKHDCLLHGKNKLTHECLPKASIVLPCTGHPTVSRGSARGAVLTLGAAIAPCGLSVLGPLPLFSRGTLPDACQSISFSVSDRLPVSTSLCLTGLLRMAQIFLFWLWRRIWLLLCF